MGGLGDGGKDSPLGRRLNCSFLFSFLPFLFIRGGSHPEFCAERTARAEDSFCCSLSAEAESWFPLSFITLTS
jgi:hypothetical protein